MPTPPHARRLAIAAGIVACLTLSAAWLTPPWLAGARVLAATVGGSGIALPGAMTRPPHPVRDRPSALAGLRARVYAPRDAGDAQHVVIFPGAHPLGIDEPRLQRLARALAGEGLVVHTAELPALRALRLDAATLPQIVDALVAARAAAGGRRVTAFGISVTGGLLLRAACEPRAAASLRAVVAVGAHHDLRTLARAYADRAASGADDELDPYGARVLASTYADALLPAEDVAGARAAILDHVSERYARARAGVAQLSPQGRALVEPLLAHPRDAIPLLMAALLRARAASLAALSPAGALGRLSVPAFLLHGERDPIVPSSETRALAAELVRSAPARVLVTPLLRHAEGHDAPRVRDALRLLDFMAAVLTVARR